MTPKILKMMHETKLYFENASVLVISISIVNIYNNLSSYQDVVTTIYLCLKWESR